MSEARTSCSTCGAPCVAVVTHTTRTVTNVLTGAFRWVQWSSCATCNARDEARWAEQRADEERERQQAAERAAKAKERDAARAAQRQRQVTT